MITVDQERMKEYIGMGFDKEEAFRMCSEEAEALNKEAAKQAKLDASKNDSKLDNNDSSGEGKSDGETEGTKFIKKEEVGDIVKDTIKGLKDDEEFKNFLTGGDDKKEPERTMKSVIENAVEKMRTGK